MVDSTADREPNDPDAFAGRAEKAPLAVPTEFTSRRLVSIQCLRGVAVLMVVFHHVLHQSTGFLAVWPTEAGQAGVDLFFVISGFVMVYVTNERERSPQQFLAMRAARIVPVYWFYTLAAAALMFVLPQLFRSNELTFKHVLLSMLFIPHESGIALDLSPVVKQGWTLNFEVFFYTLFAIAMAISVRRRVTLAVSALVVIAAAGYWLRFTGVSIGATGFYFNDIILEFAFGMLIARAFFQGKLESVCAALGVTLVVSGFAAIFVLDSWYTHSMRAFVYGLPAAAVVIGALAFERRSRALRIPFLQFAGDASYSIYLVHIFPVAVMRALWPHGPLPMQGAVSFLLFLALCLAFVIALGAASYYAVERRSLKYLRKKIERYLSEKEA
jgi:peptidoglycan/LPS O-acetylase OafA/YrhL